MSKIVKHGFNLFENAFTTSFGFYYIFNDADKVWKTTTLTFVTWSDADILDYRINGTVVYGQPDGPNKKGIFWHADFPSVIPAGTYTIAWGVTIDIASPTDAAWYGNSNKQIIKWNGTSFEPPNEDVYHADIHLLFDSSNDEYTVTWFKNGVRITSGIASPEIEVLDSSGTTLIPALTAMTQIGTTGSYKYDESINRISQAGINTHIVTANAFIDSFGRSYTKIISNNGSVIIG